MAGAEDGSNAGHRASDAGGVALSHSAALSRADLLAFNQHLAALATAGLPLEAGLRLAAQDARSSRVKRAISSLADDLERGVPLGEAFDRHRGSFPPAYAPLMEAAVATNNLPALLLSLGQHQELTSKLRDNLSRQLAYPMVVLFGVLVVAALIGSFVLPQMMAVYESTAQMARDYGLRSSPLWGGARSPLPQLPFSTTLVMSISPYLPWLAVTGVGLLVLTPVVLRGLKIARLDGVMADAVGMRLPLVGAVLRHSALSRFTDALGVATLAGLDLPRGLRLAGAMVRYPRISADAEQIARSLEAGNAPAAARTTVVPRTTLEAIGASSKSATLGLTLETLALLHRQQAELRAHRVPLVLVPLMMLLLGGLLAVLLAAVLAPLGHMMRIMQGSLF